MRRGKIFSGSSHPELSHQICEKLGVSLSPATLKKFSNRETSVEIGCSVRNEDVFVIQSGSTNINDHLMELLIMISACKGASASRITAVLPYFPYSKQSKKKKHRGAITAKMVANLLSVAGVDHIITMDLHASQMQGFFNRPVDNLFAEPSIAKWIIDSIPEYNCAVVVSKNAGGAKRVTSLADRLKVNFALIHTDRTRGKHYHHHNYNNHFDSLSSSTNLESSNNTEQLEIQSNDNEDENGNTINDSNSNGNDVSKGYCYHTSNTTSDHITTAIIDRKLSVDDDDEDDYGDEKDYEYATVNSSGTSITGEILSADEADTTTSTSNNNLNSNGNLSSCNGCNSSTITLVGNVTGKVAFIVDDIIDKSGSFIAAAEHLIMKCNAEKVYVIATHGILSGDSLKEIEKCESIHQLVITNTFPVPPEKRLQSSKLVVIDVSATLAEAIRRTHNGESISYLFYNPL